MHYSTEQIQNFIEKCKRQETLHYVETDYLLYEALKKYPLTENSTVIIGSEEPCYEALAFFSGAKQVTLVEYNDRTTDFPNFRTMLASDFEKDTELFDSALSISSVEHSGLGRYGDPVDVDGDLKAMALLHSKIKTGGKCFLAVPIGADRVEGILHRVYGKVRLPLLTSGWKIIDSYGLDNEIMNSPNRRNQPVFVLEKL